MTAPNPTTARSAADSGRSAASVLRAWLGHLCVLPAFVVLIVIRLLLAHGDPTDFPGDRNASFARRLQEAAKVELQSTSGPVQLEGTVFSGSIEMPEFPFLMFIGRGMIGAGLDPVLGVRILSVLLSLICALCLYIVAARAGPRWIAALAVWFFALNPMAVLMGRTLLPDALMLTAFMLALLLAGTARQRCGRRAAIGMTLFLLFAVMAKLPIAVFAPVAVLGYIQASGWRRVGTWMGVLACFVIVYIGTCMVYRILPLDPIAGIREIGERTNKLTDDILIFTRAEKFTIFANRWVLALTLPGSLLALAGLCSVQRESRSRYWINLWAVLAAIFVWKTIKANTYWVYAVTPIGCLLAAHGAALFVRGGWRATALLAVLVALMLPHDPAVRKVADYLRIDPAVHRIAAAAEAGAIQFAPRNLFWARYPGQIRVATGWNGFIPDDEDMMSRIVNTRRDAYDMALTTLLHGEPVETLFRAAAIRHHEPGAYLEFDLTRAPGVSVANPIPDFPAPIELGHGLSVVSGIVLDSTVNTAAGDSLDVTLIFEATPDAPDPSVAPTPPPVPSLILEARHTSGTAVMLMPTAGGALLDGWLHPQLQVPAIPPGQRREVRYTFAANPHLPTGAYTLRLRRKASPAAWLPEPDALDLGLGFSVVNPTPPDPSNTLFDPLDGYWSAPSRVVAGPAWRGELREKARLLNHAHCWLRPNVPPGRYRVEFIGSATPGGTKLEERWPDLRLYTASGHLADIPFWGSGPIHRQVDVTLAGSGDYLEFWIASPGAEWASPDAPLLYLDDLKRGYRSITLDSVALTALDKPATVGPEPVVSSTPVTSDIATTVVVTTPPATLDPATIVPATPNPTPPDPAQ